MNVLRIGFSPCPNDTFIMAALANNKVNSALTFEPIPRTWRHSTNGPFKAIWKSQN